MNAQVERCVHCALEALSLNAEQQRLAAADLTRRVVQLAAYGVPTPQLRSLIADIRELARLNDLEAHEEQEIAGELDRLSHSPHGAHTVKALAAVLRPVLRAVRHHDENTRAAALVELRSLIRATPPDRLSAPSLQHELRGSYVTLRQYVDSSAAA